ncbi:hypothetical protein KIH79_09090 [Bifidobacterium sp. 82T10]|uniref:Uncharacterized protein n=1 Tax=Bifidobacterium miconis TaxID=2834435 RepID=A0ABS6WGS5_9BIFI|nr:hypothetical protein [Bifidobacterium miconis]MBW3093072.1 hypothetical protein [Bifidobacterium miconis]
MSRFNPEMSNDRYEVTYHLTGRSGDPYRFALHFYLNGNAFDVEDMSMGDIQTLNRHIASTIREARHAKQLADQETK